MLIFHTFHVCSKKFINCVSLEKTISFHSNVNNFRKFHQVFPDAYVKRSGQEEITVHLRRFSSGKCSLLKPPWKILFFGSDAFAVSCLQALYSKL